MKDWLTRGLLFDGQVAVVAASTAGVVETARTTHDTWPVCTAALGRVLTAALMMGVSSLKEEDASLSLVFRGDGLAGNVVAVAQWDGKVRGYMDNPHVDLPATPGGKLDVAGAIGKAGTLDVLRQEGNMPPYCGQVALESGEVGEDVATYYLQSQQQPSAVYVGVKLNRDCTVARAGGLLLTPLPDAEEWVVPALEAYLDNIDAFAAALERGEGPEQALCTLFGEKDFQLLQTIPPAFACNCSAQRMQGALVATGLKNLQELAQDEKGVELRCHFCNTLYNFSQAEMSTLFLSAIGMHKKQNSLKR